MFVAMHDSFGRLAFGPKAPKVFGIGGKWAFLGEHHPVRIRQGCGGPVIDSRTAPGMEVWLRTATQLMEVKVLAGPPGSEVEALCVTDEAPPPPRGKRGLVGSSLRYDAAIRRRPATISARRNHFATSFPYRPTQ
jgi:hypothetical protein